MCEAHAWRHSDAASLIHPSEDDRAESVSAPVCVCVSFSGGGDEDGTEILLTEVATAVRGAYGGGLSTAHLYFTAAHYFCLHLHNSLILMSRVDKQPPA